MDQLPLFLPGATSAPAHFTSAAVFGLDPALARPPAPPAPPPPSGLRKLDRDQLAVLAIDTVCPVAVIGSNAWCHNCVCFRCATWDLDENALTIECTISKYLDGRDLAHEYYAYLGNAGLGNQTRPRWFREIGLATGPVECPPARERREAYTIK